MPSTARLKRSINENVLLEGCLRAGLKRREGLHWQAGDPQAAIASSDHPRRLSPFDPLLFGMFGARAMALVGLGRFEEAAHSAVNAAARPNAHPHILAITVYSLALAGSLDEARAYATDPPDAAAIQGRRFLLCVSI